MRTIVQTCILIVTLSACTAPEPTESSPGPLIEVVRSPQHESLFADADESEELAWKIEMLHRAGWSGGDRQQALPLANARGELAIGFPFKGQVEDTAVELIYLPEAIDDSHVIVRPSNEASSALFAESMRELADTVPVEETLPRESFDNSVGLLSSALSAPTTCGALNGNQSLNRNETLYSCQNNYRLVMQSDGNSVAYIGNTAIWSSRTNGTAGSQLIMQTDGNLVVYTSGGTPLWASGTQGNPGAYFRLQNDGNLVIYSSGGRALWSSGTYCDAGCVGACRNWGCQYVSETGSSPACFKLGGAQTNVGGSYYITMVRSGRTDPARCVGLYADFKGRGFACPNPNKWYSFLTCGSAR